MRFLFLYLNRWTRIFPISIKSIFMLNHVFKLNVEHEGVATAVAVTEAVEMHFHFFF